MATEKQLPDPGPASPPPMHPPPEPVSEEKSGYKMARQDIETPADLKLVENFIGSIYGQAKQIDKSNIGDSPYTKGLKFDAEKEIVELRKGSQPQRVSTQQPQMVPQPQAPTQIPIPPPQMQAPIPAPAPVPVPSGDSLILKHEIDQLKEEMKDIKKLYLEFFKLKQVKGHWEIVCDDGKTTKTTTVAKSWNTINKLLKNKTPSFTIKYVEDE